jgi:hypothetical protein
MTSVVGGVEENKDECGSFVGERVGRLGWGELRRDPSRSKDALRMTARTDNGKGEMRGFFAALRMTSSKGTAAKIGHGLFMWSKKYGE